MAKTRTSIPKGKADNSGRDSEAVRTVGVGEGTPSDPFFVQYLQVREQEEAVPPARSYPNDAGHDLVCSRHTVIPPQGKGMLPSNIILDLPAQIFALLIPRWATFYKKGLVINPGIIDSGFRGEVQVSVYNPTGKTVNVSEGDRIGQLIFLPKIYIKFVEAPKLSVGDRGTAGMGSTGGFDPRKEGE